MRGVQKVSLAAPRKSAGAIFVRVDNYAAQTGDVGLRHTSVDKQAMHRQGQVSPCFVSVQHDSRHLHATGHIQISLQEGPCGKKGNKQQSAGLESRCQKRWGGAKSVKSVDVRVRAILPCQL